MNTKTDSQIQTDVMNELSWEPRISNEQIGVAVHDGIVTLSGMVPNYAEKIAAETAAMRVRGVKGIAEEIEVRLTSPHVKNDTEIAEAVLHALDWHVWTPENLKAKVQNGWVTITGEVKYDYQRQSAANSVRYLNGVKGISNNITVKKHTDTLRIEEGIEEALKRDAELEAKQIHVTASDGTVTLSGNVHSCFEKQAAGTAAWRSPGVSFVENDLRVV